MIDYDKIISAIKVNEANLKNIAEYGIINGSLLVSLREALREAVSQSEEQREQAPKKPSEIPFFTVENMRKLVTQIPPEKRDEWVKEHSTAAAKILYTLFHSLALNTHIDTTFAFPEGDHFHLRFEKLPSPPKQ